jgi:hypothetical protein
LLATSGVIAEIGPGAFVLVKIVVQLERGFRAARIPLVVAIQPAPPGRGVTGAVLNDGRGAAGSALLIDDVARDGVADAGALDHLHEGGRGVRPVGVLVLLARGLPQQWPPGLDVGRVVVAVARESTRLDAALPFGRQVGVRIEAGQPALVLGADVDARGVGHHADPELRHRLAVAVKDVDQVGRGRLHRGHAAVAAHRAGVVHDQDQLHAAQLALDHGARGHFEILNAGDAHEVRRQGRPGLDDDAVVDVVESDDRVARQQLRAHVAGREVGLEEHRDVFFAQIGLERAAPGQPRGIDRVGQLRLQHVAAAGIDRQTDDGEQRDDRQAHDGRHAAPLLQEQAPEGRPLEAPPLAAHRRNLRSIAGAADGVRRVGGTNPPDKIAAWT